MESVDWQEFSNDIIEQLIEDGSNTEAMYGIEHHFVAENNEIADKAQQEAFLKGWDVSELEQVETEDGLLVFCFDIDTECPLDEVIINEEVEEMVAYAEANNLEYDGWGTHFEE
ncbi:ribonuclease E inhibitor RraB [Psychrosphaera haliotis]|uniref:Ribonuclease E inhibitor RraB n=1 Tax=Psychrosphaera haliotis TaxID=555083 RepID=A0A6N8FB37_9GAMM|nr:ribonuclease E inhibitor RraB [Psychrosphaera haliotis]MDA8621117.1 ribonuclease E inhibitor RraB [Psychrosphaera sp.]MUH72377.1 ribonuclease E inhibitor RraB [Psychrosphaera haliotis]